MLKFQQNIKMKNNFEILTKCPLFRGIEQNSLVAMLSCLGARVEKYKKAQTVLSEGSQAKYIGIVLAGSIQISRLDYNGNRSILTKLHSSDMLAEAFACSGISALPVEAITTAESEVMLIEVGRITHTCNKNCGFHNKMILNLLQSVSLKNIILNQKIEIISKRNTRQKLMTYLLIEAKKQNSKSFVIPYNRQELADYLEVDRSGLSAEISKLRNEGIIKCDKNAFIVL